MEVILISLIIFFIFASFIVGRYFGIMQERKRNNYGVEYLRIQASEACKDAIYDGIGDDHETFSQNDDNVVSIYFSKDDFINDLMSNKIVFCPEKNKYIKVKKDE